MKLYLKEGKLLELNFLKGFAIITIIIMHLLQYYGTNIPTIVSDLSSIGGTGVHVFIFCSGFGLFVSYYKRKIGYLEFLKRRFIKIYFPYFLIICIMSLTQYFIDGTFDLIELLSHIFLFKMFFPQYISSICAPFWFISTIFQFYLIFIALFIIKEKIGNRLFLLFSLIISIIWWTIAAFTFLGEERVFTSCFFNYLWEFALGMVIANYFIDNDGFDIKIFILIIGAVIGLLIQYVMTLNCYTKYYNDIPGMIGYTCLLLLISKINIVKNIFLKISIISFEIYLVHMIVFYIFFHYYSPNNIGIELLFDLIIVIIVLIVAFFYYLFFKKINGIVYIKKNVVQDKDE